MGHHGCVGTRILAVEDDERIRTAVKLALEDEGWTVDEAESGEEAIELFHRTPPDVVLIDIMLPGIDGFELCRTLRRTSDVPIVMVTARNDTHDVVAGLEAGADDYLTKPFAPKELSARIRALLRRIRPDSARRTPRLVFGDLEIIPDEGKVLRDGDEVHLTKTEFRLLCELAENPGKVFSREALLDKVWGYDYFGDGRLVDVHVRRLRTKVEADPANPRHVVTVRGLGLPAPDVTDAARDRDSVGLADADPVRRRRCGTRAAGSGCAAHHADLHARRAAAVDVPRRRSTYGLARSRTSSSSAIDSGHPTALASNAQDRRTRALVATRPPRQSGDRSALEHVRRRSSHVIWYQRRRLDRGDPPTFDPESLPPALRRPGDRRRQPARMIATVGDELDIVVGWPAAEAIGAYFEFFSLDEADATRCRASACRWCSPRVDHDRCSASLLGVVRRTARRAPAGDAAQAAKAIAGGRLDTRLETDRRPRPAACSPTRSTTWPRRCSNGSSATPASPPTSATSCARR